MSLRSDHSIAESTHATPVQDIVPVFGLDQYVKCAFDIAAATICLVVLSPILLISAAAIKLESLAQFLRARHCTKSITIGRLKPSDFAR